MAAIFRPLLGFVRGVNRVGESIAVHAGEMGVLTWRVLATLFTGKMPYREFLTQAYSMGIQSMPLVMVTAILSGVVTTQQGGYQFTSSIPLYVLGSVVTAGVVLELGPVLTAIVMIGRVGARITAEIGTMQVSEQIDALYSLGRDPVVVLGAPRIIAGLVTMPALVALANVVGHLRGRGRRRDRRGPRARVVPLRRAALLAQLRPVLLDRQGGRVRLRDPADLRAHGPAHAGRRRGRRPGDHRRPSSS